MRNITKVTQKAKNSRVFTYDFIYNKPQVIEIEGEGLAVVGYGNLEFVKSISEADKHLQYLTDSWSEEDWNRRYRTPAINQYYEKIRKGE